VSTDNHFLVPVTVLMPQGILGRIQGVARRHEAEVGPLIVELVRRQLVAGAARGSRRRAQGGRTYQRWTPDLDERLRTLHAAGKSDTEIGTILGRHQTVISKKRRDLGLPSNFNRPPTGRNLAAERSGEAS
jgi:hypothetical protein